MRYRALVVSLLALGGPMFLSVACSGEDTTGPENQTGAVQVTATTTGDDLDADGYTVAMDGGASRNIASNGSTTLTSVAAGQHQIELSGLAANCSVTSANPAAASVSGGATASVSFQVVCSALTGFIQVSTSTSGDDLDSDGYTATLDGSADRSIGLNGVTTFSGVAVGQHQVELTGIASNCSVGGSNPAAASVTAGETAQVSFEVTCEALPVGSLEITTTVTNNFDPDGYQVFVAGADRGRVDVDGSALFEELPAGMQQVELREIAPNCEVDGDNPAIVTIPVGGAATATFSITCASPPDGRIVFVAVGNTAAIAVVNSDGTGRLRLWECPSFCRFPAISADGRWIAFSSDHDDGATSIYTMEVDGSSLQRLTSSGDDLGPAWSPDGSALVFMRADRNGRYNLWMVDADGSALTQLTDNANEFGDRWPAWSPDGTKIAFSRGCMPGHGDCASNGTHVINADGTGLTQITFPGPFLEGCSQEWWDRFPDWHPDGSRILFIRNYCSLTGSDRSPLMLVAPDGSSLEELADGEWYWPSWSPDGLQIVVFDGAGGMYRMKADGSDVTWVAGGDEPDWGP